MEGKLNHSLRLAQGGMRERFWRVLVGQLRDAVDGADHQTPGIEHVLRLEMSRRPSAARFKFDAQEIADLAIDAVPHFPKKLTFGIADKNVSLQGNWLVELKAGAG